MKAAPSILPPLDTGTSQPGTLSGNARGFGFVSPEDPGLPDLFISEGFLAGALHGDRVEVQFQNGSTIDADVLVGADGIHSLVRSRLFGAEKAHFTGCLGQDFEVVTKAREV